MIREIINHHNILSKRNVIGYSSTLKARIKEGKEIPGTRVIRIYVSRKEPKEALSLRDLIPLKLSYRGAEYETDVVEKPMPRALTDKTSRVRPVPLGVSVANYRVTAGSLGMLFRRNREILAGSNAHVLTDDPSRSPDQIVERRICQPGPYHDQAGRDSNIVGYYMWHKRIEPKGSSTCRISHAITGALNLTAKLLHRSTRFQAYSTPANHIDFAVYRPTCTHTLEVADGTLSNEPFIGLLFAGSSEDGVICKSRYIEMEGYTPLVQPAEVHDGDTVAGSSFWCSFKTKVTDESANIEVNYGGYTAWFEDVIMVQNRDNVIRGGWSGSGWRLIK